MKSQTTLFKYLIWHLKISLNSPVFSERGAELTSDDSGCRIVKLIDSKLSRFEERITKIENDVDVLSAVEEKLNINEDRTNNLVKELQRIKQREKERNTKDSQI